MMKELGLKKRPRRPQPRPQNNIPYLGPPFWHPGGTQEFRQYCEKYHHTKAEFGRTYPTFTSKIGTMKNIILKQNTDLNRYRNELERQFNFLAAFEQEPLFRDLPQSKNGPTTELDNQADFTSSLKEKLASYRQNLLNLKRCHEDFKAHLTEVSRIEKLLKNDDQYLRYLQGLIGHYINGAVNSKTPANINLCNLEGPRSLNIDGYSAAVPAIPRFPQHYTSYDSFQQKTFTCSIGIVVDSPQKLVDETNKIFNIINNIIRQHTIEYGDKIKKIFENMKTTGPSHNIEELEKSLTDQLKDLNDKNILPTDGLTPEMISSVISDIQSTLDENRGQISQAIINALQSKVDLLGAYKTRRNEVVQNNKNNGQKKHEITDKITELKNSLNASRVPVSSATVDVSQEIEAIETILRKNLNLENIHAITREFSDLQVRAENKLTEIGSSQSRRKRSLAEGQQDYSSDISQLKDNIETNKNKFTQLVGEFEKTKADITEILATQVPAAIRHANHQYFKQRLTFDDPTKKLKEANDILIQIEQGIPQIESSYTSMHFKLNSMETEIEGYTNEADNEESEYSTFIASTQLHPSKLLHSIAVRNFGTAVSSYQNIKTKIINDKSQLSNLFKNVSQINSDTTNIKTKVADLKSSVEEANINAIKLTKVKVFAIQNFDISPRQFKQYVNEQLSNLNLSINADSLLTQSKTVKSNFEVLQNNKLSTSDGVGDLESKVQSFTSGIKELKKLKGEAVASVNTIRNELTELITQAAQTFLDTTELNNGSKNKHSKLINISKAKQNEIERSSATNLALLESEKQKILTQQEISRNLYETTKKLYQTKYNVNVNSFEGNYKSINDKYVSLLNSMKTENDAFEQRKSQVQKNLADYNKEEANKYQNEFKSIKAQFDLINESFRAIEESTDSSSYNNLVAEGRRVLSLHSGVRHSSDSYGKFIDTIVSEISKMQISGANYGQFSNTFSEIVEEAKQMIQNYEKALKDEYVKINKVSFEDSENQEFFDSAERNLNYVQNMSLSAVNSPNTTPYSNLAAEIKTEIEKLTHLKSKYSKLNFDSILSKFYPNLPIIIKKVGPNEVTITNDIRTTENTHQQLTELQTDFNSEKQSFNLLYNEFETSKKRYDSIIQNLLDLSGNKLLQDSEIQQKMDELKQEKDNLMRTIKEKTLSIKESFKKLREIKAEYDQSLVTLSSTISSLASLKQNSDSELASLKAQNAALSKKLEKALLAVNKKEESVQKLSPIQEDLLSFISKYPTNLSSQKTESVTTIDSAIQKLRELKEKTIRETNEFKIKIDQLSQFYNITRGRFNSDARGIIRSQYDRLSTNEQYCDTHIVVSKDKKTQIENEVADLDAYLKSNSPQLTSGLTNAISDLDCCENILNGQECVTINTKRFDQCVSYVTDFNVSKEKKSVEDFKSYLQSSLESLRLPNHVDDFVIRGLSSLSTDPKILSEKIQILESLFKNDFKKIKIAQLRHRLADMDTELEAFDITVNSSLDLIKQNENSSNNKLNEYEKNINNHERKYTAIETKFQESSSKAEKLIKEIGKEAKNNYILNELNKKPSFTEIISLYTNSLQVDEKMVKNSKENISGYRKELSNLMSDSNNNGHAYTQLKSEIDDLRKQLDGFERDKSLIEKEIVVDKTNEIQDNLMKKNSEVELNKIRVSNDLKKINEFNRKISNEHDQAVSKIRELNHQIDQNMTHTNSLLKKLNSLKESSSTINVALSKLTLFKSELQDFQSNLTNKNDKMLLDITSEKTKLSKFIKNANELLESAKKKYDDKINEYSASYKELLKTANDQSTDVPNDISAKNFEYLSLKSSMQNQYEDNVELINNYQKSGEKSYEKQQEYFSQKYSELKATSESKISQINSMVNALTKLDLNTDIDNLQSSYDEIVSSIENFILENKEISFAVNKYNEEVDIGIDELTADIENEIQIEITKNNETINSLLTSDNKKPIEGKTNQLTDVKSSLEDSEDFYDSEGESERQVAEGANKSVEAKDYFKMIVGIASVATIAMVVVGSVIYYRNMKKKEIYKKCESIYIKA